MRLTCPNCDAQYEVEDDLIPPEGRDVQCSNCTTTWFEQGTAAKAEAVQTTSESETIVPSAGPTAPDPSDDAVIAAAAAASARRAAPPSSKLDPEALDIIRQEVERETRARDEERGGLETQTDLGLDDPGADAATAARDRIARRRGVQSDPEVEDTSEGSDEDFPDPAEANTKSELLPDIEEINSTLADAPDPVPVDEVGAEDGSRGIKSSRRGFRIGFGLMLLFFAGLIALYAFNSEMSDSVPALSEPLDQYRMSVDEGRVWLDGAAQTLVEKINGLIGQISGS